MRHTEDVAKSEFIVSEGVVRHLSLESFKQSFRLRNVIEYAVVKVQLNLHRSFRLITIESRDSLDT